jgi:hypothetical protein
MHRQYEKAKTPYHRLMESKQLPTKSKKQLKKIYNSLNQAQLFCSFLILQKFAIIKKQINFSLFTFHFSLLTLFHAH